MMPPYQSHSAPQHLQMGPYGGYMHPGAMLPPAGPQVPAGAMVHQGFPMMPVPGGMMPVAGGITRPMALAPPTAAPVHPHYVWMHPGIQYFLQGRTPVLPMRGTVPTNMAHSGTMLPSPMAPQNIQSSGGRPMHPYTPRLSEARTPGQGAPQRLAFPTRPRGSSQSSSGRPRKMAHGEWQGGSPPVIHRPPWNQISLGRLSNLWHQEAKHRGISLGATNQAVKERFSQKATSSNVRVNQEMADLRSKGVPVNLLVRSAAERQHHALVQDFYTQRERNKPLTDKKTAEKEKLQQQGERDPVGTSKDHAQAGTGEVGTLRLPQARSRSEGLERGEPLQGSQEHHSPRTSEVLRSPTWWRSPIGSVVQQGSRSTRHGSVTGPHASLSDLGTEGPSRSSGYLPHLSVSSLDEGATGTSQRARAARALSFRHHSPGPESPSSAHGPLYPIIERSGSRESAPTSSNQETLGQRQQRIQQMRRAEGRTEHQTSQPSLHRDPLEDLEEQMHEETRQAEEQQRRQHR